MTPALVILAVVSSSFLPPAPRISTLFPYTTLFRSRIRRKASSACQSNGIWTGIWKLCVEDITFFIYRQGCGTRDRKSTRLNSSHRCISYAVFCLKKKKQDSTIVDQENLVGWGEVWD